MEHPELYPHLNDLFTKAFNENDSKPPSGFNPDDVNDVDTIGSDSDSCVSFDTDRQRNAAAEAEALAKEEADDLDFISQDDPSEGFMDITDEELDLFEGYISDNHYH